MHIRARETIRHEYKLIQHIMSIDIKLIARRIKESIENPWAFWYKTAEMWKKSSFVTHMYLTVLSIGAEIAPPLPHSALR